MEGPDEGNHGLINRLDAPPVPVVDFPLPQDVNDEANRTVDISSDEKMRSCRPRLGRESDRRDRLTSCSPLAIQTLLSK